MVSERDFHFVLNMEPLVEHIKANYTGTQIKTLLDITDAQLITLNTKYNNVVNNKADLLAAGFL